jgi:hypothetical protein
MSAYGVECTSDTLREADYYPQQAEEESLKDEGEIEKRGRRHRGKLGGGGVSRNPCTLRASCAPASRLAGGGRYWGRARAMEEVARGR